MRYITFDKPAGLWRVRPIVNGRRMNGAYFVDLAEAIAWRDTKLAESHAGDVVDAGAVTVGTMARRWLAERKQEVDAGSLARNTYRDYERIVRLHIADTALGRRKLRENLTPVISQHLAARVDGGEHEGEPLYSPQMRKRMLIVLRQVFDLAMRWELMSKNPAKLVKTPRQRLPRPDAWTEAEARAFLAKTASSPLNLLWRFLLSTGARAGEACGLRWEDVDLDGSPATISFVQQRMRSSKKDGDPLFGPLKTERSRREIAIDADLARRLREHYAASADLRALSRTNLVFLSQVATPLELANVGRRWRLDVKRSGVRRLKLHGTRSTHTTITLERGSRIEDVSRRLGHSTTAFTADVYKKYRAASAIGPALHIAEALSQTTNGLENGLDAVHNAEETAPSE